MQWSKIKKRAESLICDSLQGRVEYFSTWYRDSGHDRIGRATVLVDKEEVFEADSWKKIFGRNEFERIHFHSALQEYLNMSIDDAIACENPIIRGLAMIDYRLGKRRLSVMHLPDNEHRFVRFMYQLRCQAEPLDCK